MLEVSIHYPVLSIVGVEHGIKVLEKPSRDRVRVEFAYPKRPFLWWGTVREAEQIQYPKGYGVAYYDFVQDRLLFALMPFNILIGGIIWFYRWMRIGFASWCFKHIPKGKNEFRCRY